MTKNHRFVTASELEEEQLHWARLHWLCRTSICEAEQLMLCRVDILPGEGHNFHRHPELEEIIYVIEGEAEQWVDREKRILKPGEIAHIPRDTVHATFNPTGSNITIVAILSPAKHQGPFLVDVYEEEPWRSLRS
jgi:quercetin dioxygenase-like cupin family protein